MRTLSVGLAIVALTSVSIPVAAAEVVVAAETAPSALDGFELPDDVEALAFSPDGGMLAYASYVGGPKQQSKIVRRGAETGSILIRGRIRDLLLLKDGRLLGLLYRPAKKWEGDSYLFSWEPGAKKAERLMRVPPSAADLDRWDARGGIVLACKNEIRTFMLPDLRSGPVFMFPGDNRALTTLGASPFLWIGQDAGLFLIDLASPSGREPMAVVTQREVSLPVAGLAAYPDGETALVRLDDGRLYRATLDPPGFEPAGIATHVAGLGKGSSAPPIARRPPPPPVVEETIEAVPAVEPEPAKPAVVEPEPVAEPVVTKVEPPPSEEPVAEPEPAKPAVVEPEPVVETVVTKVEPPAAEEPVAEPEPAKPAVVEPEPPASTHQVSGKLVGSLELVREVVLRGPNNILHEAARVSPGKDGRWGVDGLAPGRYRIQVDGGGDRVLVADPSLVLVNVGDGPVVAPEIRILRAF